MTLTFATLDCGVKVDSTTSQQQGGAVEASLVKLKTSLGYFVFSRNAVKSIDVTLLIINSLPSDSNRPTLTRTFTGQQIQTVLDSFKLNAPSSSSAIPRTITTGKIALHYQINPGDPLQNRSLSIENSRLIEDLEFPNIFYQPARDLDPSWLSSIK